MTIHKSADDREALLSELSTFVSPSMLQAAAQCTDEQIAEMIADCRAQRAFYASLGLMDAAAG